MDAIYDMIVEMFGDGSVTMLAVLVFLVTAVLTLGGVVTVYLRGAVKRRAAGVNLDSGKADNDQGSLRQSGTRAVQRVLDYTNKHYSQGDKGDARILRRRMILAGIFDPRAVALFFVARTALAVGLAVAVFFVLPMLITQSMS